MSTELTLSKHALSRIKSRGIHFNIDVFMGIRGAMLKLQDKGSREAIILTEKSAFIVSVKNNMVISAVGIKDLKDKVFTNIDSIIIL